MDSLSAGPLFSVVLCRSGVRTKFGINMVTLRELNVPRLSKEGRTGPGWKHNRQKSPCRTVVGSRLWIGSGWQPVQYSWTRSFFIAFLLFLYVYLCILFVIFIYKCSYHSFIPGYNLSLKDTLITHYSSYTYYCNFDHIIIGWRSRVDTSFE